MINRLFVNKKILNLFFLLLGIVGFLIVTINIGKGISTSNEIVGLLILSLFGVFLIWFKVEYGLYLIILMSFFMDWLTEEAGLFPHAFSWIIEAILILLFIKILLPKINRKLIRGSNIDKILLIIVILGIVSALINGFTIVNILLGFRVYFKFIIVFYIIINTNFSEKTYKNLIIFLLAMILFQVPIALWQFFILHLLYDSATGSIRGAGIICVLSISMICLLWSLYLYYKSSIKYIILSILLFILPVLGEAKAFFFFF
ncbi:MAG TPA: hypothetical protein VGB37_16615, partial [Candidatus Lokiarchaeia archaeon]